jgi:sodium/bile acid cotransporter 7
MAIFCIPQGGFAQQVLSDAQKKEAVYTLYREYKKEFPEVMDIMPQEAMGLFARDKIVFVDTRGEKEMRVSMLPRALSKEEFLQDPDKYKGKKIVGYCTISYRSGLLAKKLAEKDITLYNLVGGILAWTLEGGKVYDEKGETKRIHIYNEKWNYPPDGYEPVQFGFFERLF